MGMALGIDFFDIGTQVGGKLEACWHYKSINNRSKQASKNDGKKRRSKELQSTSHWFWGGVARTARRGEAEFMGPLN